MFLTGTYNINDTNTLPGTGTLSPAVLYGIIDECINKYLGYALLLIIYCFVHSR